MLRIFAVRLALGIAIALLVLALAEPLAVFLVECLNNPEVLKLEMAEVSQVNSTHSVVSIRLSYGGRTVLKGFRIRIAGEEVVFGDVVAGEYRREVVVPAPSLRESGGYDIEFSVAGLYRVREVVRPRPREGS